jgi:hypothetical protein
MINRLYNGTEKVKQEPSTSLDGSTTKGYRKEVLHAEAITLRLLNTARILTIPANELPTRLTTILRNRLVFLGLSLENVLSSLLGFRIGFLDRAIGDGILTVTSLASLDDY